MNYKKLEALIKKALKVNYNEEFKNELRSKFQTENHYSFGFGRILIPISLLVVVAIFSFISFEPRGSSIFEKAYAENARMRNEVQEHLVNGDILYEKVLFEISGGMPSSIQESWYDNNGNFLSVPRDPETNEILYAEWGGPMMFRELNGKGVIYSSEKFAEEVALPSLSYECIEKDENLMAYIDLSENNFSNYSFGGGSVEDNSTQDELDEAADKDLLMSLKKSFTGNSEVIFNDLKERQVFDYNEIEENGITYYMFEDDWESNSARTIEKHYIDPETYRLVKSYYQYFDENGDFMNDQTIVFLASDYISADRFDEIFDFEKYNLYLQPDLSADPAFNHDEEGCYFPNGTKMTNEQKEDFWNNQVPSVAKKEFEGFVDEIKSFK